MGLLDRIRKNHKIVEVKTLKGKYNTFQFHIRENGMVIVAKGDIFIAHTAGISAAFQAVTQSENDKKSVYSEKDFN